jgi:hypothetical protein
MSKKYGSPMIGPTIRVGGATLWLDGKALRRGEMRLDRESVSQQCDDCGSDIVESGTVHAGKDLVIRCECGAVYPVVVGLPL